MNLAWWFQRRCFLKQTGSWPDCCCCWSIAIPCYIFVEGYPRKLPVKFHWIWTGSLREDVCFKAKKEVDQIVIVVVDQLWPLFVFFVEGYPRKLPVKFHWIWTGSFRDVFKAKQEVSFLLLLLLLLLINHDPLLYFCRGTPKEASCEVSLNLAM